MADYSFKKFFPST